MPTYNTQQLAMVELYFCDFQWFSKRLRYGIKILAFSSVQGIQLFSPRKKCESHCYKSQEKVSLRASQVV